MFRTGYILLQYTRMALSLLVVLLHIVWEEIVTILTAMRMLRCPMRAEVTSAMPIFSRHNDDDDEVLLEALCAAGHDRQVAINLIVFMPIAFTRVLFAGTGVNFCDSFVHMGRFGKLAPLQSLTDEPVFRAALALARSGISKDILRMVACRSAEYDAIQDALDDGARLKDLVISPTILN